MMAAVAVYRSNNEKRAINKQAETDRKNIFPSALPGRDVKCSFRNSDTLAGPEERLITTMPESGALPENVCAGPAGGERGAATAQ